MKKIKKIPSKTIVYITGRYAPQELIDISDFATELTTVKQPKKLPKAKKGIEY